MSEFVSECIRSYKSSIQLWQQMYNNYIDLFLKSLEISFDNVNPISDNKNIMYFNGYLKGYEAAQNDYKQMMPQEKYKDASSIYF